jgi:hypothetical protein
VVRFPAFQQRAVAGLALDLDRGLLLMSARNTLKVCIHVNCLLFLSVAGCAAELHHRSLRLLASKNQADGKWLLRINPRCL